MDDTARSRLLSRLDAEIAQVREPIELACRRAERAGVLGRHGLTGQGRAELQELQRLFAHQPHVAVSAWIALAEGQLDHYASLGDEAHDRFQRARALSAAAGLRPLQALSAAWLAHTAYGRGEGAQTAACCAEALRLAAPDHHGAHWRAALTAACAYHFAGREDLARPWYTAARAHAMADGDDVGLSALIYNQASLRGAEACFAAAIDGGTRPEQAASAAHGAQSSGHYDRLAGVQSLDWLVPMLQAQLLLLEDRAAAALALIDTHWPRSGTGWRARMQPCVVADRAWCLLQLGREADAREEAAHAAAGIAAAPSDLDDRARAHARLSQLHARFGDAEIAARHRAAAEADARAHRQAQQALLAQLDAALGERHPTVG